MIQQGAYEFWKTKFSCFPDVPDHLNSFFQTTITYKHDLTNRISSQFGSFLAQLQNIVFKVHGDWLHPRQSLCQLCNYAVNSMLKR